MTRADRTLLVLAGVLIVGAVLLETVRINERVAASALDGVCGLEPAEGEDTWEVSP